MSDSGPRVTVVIPSLNQGTYLDAAIASVFQQDMIVDVFVLDGGSTDNSRQVIDKWQDKLTWHRSEVDSGQAAAINEGVRRSKTEYVCWLNSDDTFLPQGLARMCRFLDTHAQYPMVYGKCWTTNAANRKLTPYLTLPFSRLMFANFCFIAQPATLIRRVCWEAVGGVNEDYRLAFDYDLWWKLYSRFGKPGYLREFVATTRTHAETKTANNTRLHYAESARIVQHYLGRVPLKWRTLGTASAAFQRMLKKF